MTHHLNWTRIGKSLRASALDAHDGALPPVDLAYSFLSGNPECFIDSNEWPADMPTMTTVRQGGAETLAFTYHAGTTYVFEHTVGGADKDGIYDASITMVDKAGNSVTRNGSTFEVKCQHHAWSRS